MSHFTVLVIGDDVEKQLQPYHEYECTGINDEFVVFVDCTAEVTREFNEDTTGRIRMPDGELLSPYDERFYRDPTIEEEALIGGPHIGSGIAHGLIYKTEYKDGDRNLKIQDHEGVEEVDVVFSEVYESLKEYAENYHNYEILEDGRIGHKTNPDSRWDWWVVGGRWSGILKVKEGANASLGQPGVFGNEAKDGYADCLLKGDVDIEGMRKDAARDANMEYDRFQAVTSEFLVPILWDEFRANYDDIEVARKAYADIPFIKAIREAQMDPWMSDPVEYFCAHTGGREQFVKNAVNRVGVPYAVVKDSIWYEKGTMGWWGMGHNESDQDEWNEQFSKLLDETPDDTLLTMVDCHI